MQLDADLIPAGLEPRLRQAFLLGLARSPVTLPAALAARLPGVDPTLALLALTGQRRRFAAAATVVADAVPDAARALHGDPRPILPPLARRALARLSGSVEKSLAATVMPAALRRIAGAGLRPHPFDLPALGRHIKADPENHGRSERAFIALTAGDGDDHRSTSLFEEAVTVENWTGFPPAQRRLFVATVRRRDPAAGRALVEGVWKTEPAAVRAALLAGLATALGADDRPFLDGLASDRADSVRSLAARLARLAARAGLEERLAEAARCFRRADGALAAAGIGGVVFVPPGTAAAGADEQQAERERLFSGVPLDALADAVGATAAEIVAALPEDEDQVRTLLTEAMTGAAARAVAGARLLAIARMPAAIVKLLAEARGPVDPGAAAQFLAGPVWAGVRARFAGTDADAQDDTQEDAHDDAREGVARDDGSLVGTAALLPAVAMPAFAAALTGLPPTATRAALDFADLVLALPTDATPSGAAP